jgi:hypothetical protein
MKTSKLFVIITLFIATYVSAQNYDHGRYIFSTNSGTYTGGNYTNTFVIGEPFTNVTITGGPYSMSSGFLSRVQNCNNILGDANIDGQLDVGDLVFMVGIIFGEIFPNDCQFLAADVYENGIISVTDIVAVVQIILGGSLTKGNALENAELYNGDERLKVVAVGDIAGMQFEVNGDFGITKHFLPVGWEISRSDHTILMFSTDGTPLIDEVLFEYSGELAINSNIIVDWHGNSITATISSIIPTDYVLLSAYPNPFNPVTAISFELPDVALFSLRIYDMNGSEVADLLSGEMSAGYHTVNWEATGKPSGIYFVKLVSADYTSTQKLMLVK